MAETPTSRGGPYRAVLLDAMGTLLRLVPPAPLLRRRLLEAGFAHSPRAVEAALRREIVYYRANHMRGRDAAGLRDLRLDCARVLGDALGGDVPAPSRLAEMLVDSLRFELMPDAPGALAALDRAGVRLAVVSNWDVSLTEVLNTLGIAGRFHAICISAVEGAAKPDPAIFHTALRRLGVSAERALHCGDDPVNDGEGALAAGIRPVLVDRSHPLVEGRFGLVRSLAQLTSLADGQTPNQRGTTYTMRAKR